MIPSTHDARYVLGRIGWATAVIWIVLTVTYAVIAVLPATRLVGFSSVEMGINAVTDSAGSPLQMYLDWMWAFLTLNWGQSTFYNKPVTTVYASRLPVTLAYVVPGLLASLVLGTGVTTYAAVKPDSLLNRTLSALSYLGLGLPAFVAAELLLVYFPIALGWTYVPDAAIDFWDVKNLQRLALAATIVALTFAAVQIRHVQSETTEYLSAEFVKTARSKGGSRLRIGIHIFRNAWPTFVSIILGEALGLLVLLMIVLEYAWNIEGAAVAVFEGFGSGDPMVSFVAVFGMVFLGVFGTLVRDFARLAFDPRVDS